MSELSAEDLRVLAEGMGYVIFSVGEQFVTVWDGKDIHTRKRYKPHTTNDTQCMEIMEKLHININYIYENDVEAKVGRTYKSSGKTINEAVCKAALEYFKEAK